MASTGWNDPTEAVLAGTGQIYVAAVGSTAPTSASSSLSASTWSGLGYTTEEGVSTNFSAEIMRFGSWQTKADIRRERGNETFRITCNLLQWNEINVPLAFGGGSVTDDGGGNYTYTPPASTAATTEKALIADIVDGSNRLRFYIPRGTVVEAVDSQFNRNALGTLPISFEAMEPDDGTPSWKFFSNLSSFATGS